jgi:hypothetical protein
MLFIRLLATMINKYLYILLLILPFNCANAQTKAYVWNVTGAQVKESPTNHSKTIKKLKFGEYVTRSHFTDSTPVTKSTQSPLGNYPIVSHWTMVEFGDQIGFIFEPNLSNDKVPTIEEYGIIRINYKQLLGKKINDTSLIETQIIDKREFKIETDITYYVNGSYEYTAFDGCFDHTYEFTNIEFNKVLLIAMSMYSSDITGGIYTPQFSEEQDGSIMFWGTEATVQVIISKSKNGWKIYSYDCT